MRIFLIGLTSSVMLSVTFLVVSSAKSAGPELSRSDRKTESYKGHPVAAGEVLVKFSDLASAAAISAAKQDSDIESDQPVGGQGARLFRSRSKTAEALVQQLSGRSDVVYAEPNYIIHVDDTPNDPRYPELYGLHNINNPSADISAELAWDVSKGSQNTVIGVVDTGVDYNHPDLAANMWSAPSSFTVHIAGEDITCGAGTHGFNAVTNTCTPLDDHSHGTHVAGTIGAVGNNGTGVVGVNWTASMMAIKIMDATGNGTVAEAVNGIEFAVQAKQHFAATGGAKVRVLSNSWGGDGPSQTLLNAINQANSNEMLFVAAAGNAGSNNDVTPFYPANYNAPNIISVAATDYSDNLAGFSNYGASKVHLGAPGVGILSTTRNNSYGYMSGTSMATPHVSGAAALVLSGCSCSLNTAGLKNVILANTDLIPAMSGKSITGGRLNVNKALRAAAPTPSPVPVTGYVKVNGDYFSGTAVVSLSTASGQLIKSTVSANGGYFLFDFGLRGNILTATSQGYVFESKTVDGSAYYILNGTPSGGPTPTPTPTPIPSPTPSPTPTPTPVDPVPVTGYVKVNGNYFSGTAVVTLSTASGEFIKSVVAANGGYFLFDYGLRGNILTATSQGYVFESKTVDGSAYYIVNGTPSGGPTPTPTPTPIPSPTPSPTPTPTPVDPVPVTGYVKVNGDYFGGTAVVTLSTPSGEFIKSVVAANGGYFLFDYGLRGNILTATSAGYVFQSRIVDGSAYYIINGTPSGAEMLPPPTSTSAFLLRRASITNSIDGADICSSIVDLTNNASYAHVRAHCQSMFMAAARVSDKRAVQPTTISDRIATTWYKLTSWKSPPYQLISQMGGKEIFLLIPDWC